MLFIETHNLSQYIEGYRRSELVKCPKCGCLTYLRLQNFGEDFRKGMFARIICANDKCNWSDKELFSVFVAYISLLTICVSIWFISIFIHISHFSICLNGYMRIEYIKFTLIHHQCRKHIYMTNHLTKLINMPDNYIIQVEDENKNILWALNTNKNVVIRINHIKG